MKEFHIINVGASIITNYQKSLPEGDETKNKLLSDNNFWESKLNDSEFLKSIYTFVKEKPMERSAELNSFLRKVEGSNNQIEVYFVGTKTPVNEICVRTLERFMKERGYTVYMAKEVPGYFMETSYGGDRVKSFIEGISDMLDHLIKIAEKKKEEAYKVYFNPTGGFKVHVATMALAGFMTGCEVYYIHEEFQDLITFPPLFYIPKGKEREVLEILMGKSERYVTGEEFDQLIDKFNEEMDRLAFYGLAEYEFDENNRPFRFRITYKGKLIFKQLKEGK
ncbi:putative CRISPR-associated protein [Thermodesulfovibrio sp. TK110]